MTNTIKAHKSCYGRYWLGQVNDQLTCTHLHRTPKAAIACAKRWLAFQNKVAQYAKTHPPSIDSIRAQMEYARHKH